MPLIFVQFLILNMITGRWKFTKCVQIFKLFVIIPGYINKY